MTSQVWVGFNFMFNQKEYLKNYYQIHKEKIKEKGIKYYKENKKERKEYSFKHYQENKEEVKEQTKQWRKNNPEKYRKCQKENNKKFRKENPEYHKNYRKDNKEYYALQTLKRHIKKKNLGGSFTLQEWNNLKKKCNYTCQECGLKEPFNQYHKLLTIDHITPIDKWKEWIKKHSEINYLCNDIENIQPLCMKCNSIKNTKIIFFKK